MFLYRFNPCRTAVNQQKQNVVLFLMSALFVTSIVIFHHDNRFLLQFNEVTGSISMKRGEQKRLQTTSDHLNLLDETSSSVVDLHHGCTLDYINTNKLAQDHPCVIQIIRRDFLQRPSPPDVPYNLTHSIEADGDPSAGQVSQVLHLLKNKMEGFFVECGALDGDWLSNSLYLERSLKWTGLLIEANPTSYQKLLSRNRKSWTLPVCLSLEPYPTQVSFYLAKGEDAPYAHIVDPDPGTFLTLWDRSDIHQVKVQCFPLYSILLAANRTRVDFFSLDVEGHELKILKTVPWHKVDIKILTVEWEHIPGGGEPLIRYMERNGFRKAMAIRVHPYARDIIFVKENVPK